MKKIKMILIVATLVCYSSCNAQNKNKVANTDFQSLLNKYVTINPPINYKRIENLSKDMTKQEAIQFFHKTENDLVWNVEEIGEDDVIYTSKEDYVPGCKFKYKLNDSIYMLCTLEQSGEAIEDSTWVALYSFTKEGIMIDRYMIGGEFSYNTKCVSFVLLDKNHVRVFYYNRDYTRKDEGYFSTVYYINYEITDKGNFIKKDKSDITYLKDTAIQYSTYKPKSDDPMNEYDF
ncbi:MAG: hypothetical protein FWD60_11475 [Candidatus Azobacteroides sp.]|nr:hypothetical protein [Candidatus Azobacteroides sp.]